MAAYIEVACIQGGPQLTVNDIHQHLKARFDQIKEMNPKGYRDQFEQQFDVICCDIAQELGGVVTDYEENGDSIKFFDFTGRQLIRTTPS